ncbi:MAG: ArsR/SmtB family transcription factor [Candidatus Hodarchaeales archaeon]|jgi:DNA-binding transcriptional ArsR family regulator
MSKKTIGLDFLGSLAEIAEITKSISHEKRLKILTLVMDEAQDFSSLLAKTELQKTALSNHLSKMLQFNLIKRLERGKYLITVDGRKLLNLITSFYNEKSVKQELERKKLIHRYSHRRMKKMDKKLTIKPKYQPCWISYLGSVSGVMKALGKEEHDLVNTGGYTGYSFALPNVSKGTTCPSGPTSLGKMWQEIMKGTDALGYNTKQYDDPNSYPAQEGLITPEDRNRANKLFQRVKIAIDNNNPAILWGLPIPEYGIVTGYQENSYLVSTFRSLINQPDDPVAFDALQAPGGLHAIIFKNQTSEILLSEDRNALQRAITLAEGHLTENNYVAGVHAYEEWANVLETAPQENVLYHGNSYVNECTLEAKDLSAAFLGRIAKNTQSEPFSAHLIEAAEKFNEVVKLLKSFQKIFPFAFEGDLSEEKRLKGAKILQEAIPHEEQALAMMKKALDAWKN